MNRFQELINSDQPVLVDFYADWCGPCKQLAPELKKLKSDFGDRITIIKIDVDRHPKLAASLQVRGVPTLVLYRSGRLLWRQSGFQTAQQLSQAIYKHIS